MAGDHGEQALLLTPVWAIASACLIFIFFGTSAEHLICLVSRLLNQHKKNALYEAMEKLKTVLMELGLMSLILSVAQDPISKLCITNAAAHTMHTCTDTEELPPSSDYCRSKGKTSFMSVVAMHELHMFIFVLAVMRIFYSLAHMGLGMLKMKRWASWEREARNIDPERLTSRYATEPTFLWIRCFFRQFFPSMTRDHYFTLRQAVDDSANFQKHVQQSLEDDFKAVIGINPIMYMLVVIFMFGNLLGERFLIWPSFPFLPLLAMLIVGAKVETIVAKVAQGHLDSSTINHLFWFNRPQLVMTFIRFILFTNTFNISFSIWVIWQYGIDNCVLAPYDAWFIIRIVVAVIVQVLGSYNTLPFYALVIQMGSKHKSTVLEEPTDAPMLQQSLPPPTCTEYVHSDEEIVEIRCEGSADASTSHQPLPTVSMPPHPISHTPPEDAEITLEEEDAEVEDAEVELEEEDAEITLVEEDVEVSLELEETGEDATSGEPGGISPGELSPKEDVTKPDAQSFNPGDPPLSNE